MTSIRYRTWLSAAGGAAEGVRRRKRNLMKALRTMTTGRDRRRAKAETETDAEAERLFWPRAYWKLMRGRGGLRALISPDEAAAHPYSDSDLRFIAELRANALIGSAARVGDMLRQLAEREKLDEIVILTWAHDQADRRRSFELLAREFGPGGRTAVAP